MIYQKQGYSSLSNTNISKCKSEQAPSFHYWEVQSTPTVSFCNFENLEAKSYMISCFSFSNGKIERCNYINNIQTSGMHGIIFAVSGKLEITDSVFDKNTLDPLFYAYSGEITIIHCHIDKPSTYAEYAAIDTSRMTTESFSNKLKFIGLNPCEGDIEILYIRISQKLICSLNNCRYFFFGKSFVSFLLISKKRN